MYVQANGAPHPSPPVPSTLDPSLSTSDGLVDKVFRTRRLRLEDGTMYAGMHSGKWMRDAASQVAPGAIGVLMDIALGGAAMQRRPENTWAVTTNLSLHFTGPLPVDGSEILARGRCLVADETGCMAEGEAVDAAGRVLVKGSTWLQYVSNEPDIERYANTVHQVRTMPQTITEVLGLEAGAEPTQYVFEVGQNLLNVNSALHGGASVALAEAAATRYLNDPLFTLATVNLSYLRPGVDRMRLKLRPAHRGRSLQILEATFIGANGKPCVIANLHYRRIG